MLLSGGLYAYDSVCGALSYLRFLQIAGEKIAYPHLVLLVGFESPPRHSLITTRLCKFVGLYERTLKRLVVSPMLDSSLIN